MNSDIQHTNSPLRTTVGNCLILAVVTVSLCATLKAVLIVGLISAAILLALIACRVDAARHPAVGSMLAVTCATLLGIVVTAHWPIDQRDASRFSLLVVFNVLLLAQLLGGPQRQATSRRLRQALLTSALFVATVALLLLLKTALSHVLGGIAEAVPKPLHLPWLLYPGGILLLGGLLYRLLGNEGEGR